VIATHHRKANNLDSVEERGRFEGLYAPPLYGGQWRALFPAHALHSPCSQPYVQGRVHRVGTGAFSLLLNPAPGTPI